MILRYLSIPWSLSRWIKLLYSGVPMGSISRLSAATMRVPPFLTTDTAPQAAFAVSQSPTKTPVICISLLRVTLVIKSTPTVCATSTASSWHGFPSRIRLSALGFSRNSTPWNLWIVLTSTSPGQMDFLPPEIPVMKWLSTRPVAILRSEKKKSRLT